MQGELVSLLISLTVAAICKSASKGLGACHNEAPLSSHHRACPPHGPCSRHHPSIIPLEHAHLT